MRLASNVFDVWAFQRTDTGVRFFLLYTAEEKARRHFSGGRFWQIPSGFVNDGENVTDAIGRELGRFGLTAASIWARFMNTSRACQSLRKSCAFDTVNH